LVLDPHSFGPSLEVAHHFPFVAAIGTSVHRNPVAKES
jgi:hypothetical protein